MTNNQEAEQPLLVDGGYMRVNYTDDKPPSYTPVTKSMRSESNCSIVSEERQDSIKKSIRERGGSLSAQKELDRVENLNKMSEIKVAQTQDPIKITFKNVDYKVKVRCGPEERRLTGQTFKQLHILKDCSGVLLPGQTHFIMGASGAGKTSLLNALSDRIGLKPGDSLQGDIMFNDKYKLDQSTFGRFANYVMQDDVIFRYFTVREALTFAARLKLKIPEADQDRRINSLIEDLGLSHCADSMVGSVLKKVISGGERKRTAIGVELITDPRVVLLDEPTSGLDSFTAVKICKILKEIARKHGKTICATIHQPSSQAFKYFDKLILMCDGHIVYQGDAKDSTEYFKDMGFKINRYDNPADAFMRTLSISYPKSEVDEDKIQRLVKTYNNEQKQSVLLLIENFKVPDLDLGKAGHIGVMAPFKLQMQQLTIRNKAMLSREPQAGRAKIFNSIFTGLLIIMIYWQVNQPTPTDIADMAGAVFFWLVGLLMSNMFNTILIFQAERPVFLRENANQMYSISAYYISKNTIELPTSIFLPGVQLALIYWAVGFRSDNWIPEFFQMWLLGFLVVQCALSYGYFISSSVKQMEAATAVAPLLTMPTILFGGLFINTTSMPAYISWIRWTSPVYYANCGILLAQWRTAPNPNPIKPNPYHEALDFLIGDISFTECVYALIALLVIWRVASYIALKRSVTKFQ